MKTQPTPTSRRTVGRDAGRRHPHRPVRRRRARREPRARRTRPALSTLDIEPDWFGALSSSSALSGAHAAALADAQAALDRLGGALEKDADGLYQVAFSVLVADQDAANRLRGGR
jgi:hypothetical protein